MNSVSVKINSLKRSFGFMFIAIDKETALINEILNKPYCFIVYY